MRRPYSQNSRANRAILGKQKTILATLMKPNDFSSKYALCLPGMAMIKNKMTALSITQTLPLLALCESASPVFVDVCNTSCFALECKHFSKVIRYL